MAELTPLSRKAIYGAIRRGELPARKRCGRWLIREQDLEEWVAAGEPPAPDQEPEEGVRRHGGRARAPARGSLAALKAIEAEAC